MSIRKSNNKVSIAETDTPFGGEVVDLSYSISFSASPSSVSVTIANSSGSYDEPELNSEDSMLLEFGSMKMKMLPVAYKKSGSSSAKTMTVEFDDMSLKYLDKTFVLLNDKQICNPLPRVIKIGRMFIEDPNSTSGALKRFYGQYRPDASVKYDIRELAYGIYNSEIPISKSFYSFLKEFKGYKLDAKDEIVDRSFTREDSGSLRDVLSSIAGELGFIFFWNNSGQRTSVYNFKENEGFLDFIKLSKDIDIEQVRENIKQYTDVCNIQDETEEVSIRGSSIKGAIGSFRVQPSFQRSKSEPFARFKFHDKVTSKYTGNTIDLIDSTKRQKFDLELLMKASLVSLEFYRKYVLLKLIRGSFASNFNPASLDATNETLIGRNQQLNGSQSDPEDEGLIIGDWYTKFKGAKYPLLIQRNAAVEQLYDLGVYPAVLSVDQGVKEAAKAETEEDEDKGVREDNSVFGKQVQRYINQQESFILGLKDVKPRWVAAVIDKGPKIDSFLKNDGQDPVFTQINFLAKNFSRYYFSIEGSGRATNPALVVEKNFSRRNYGGVKPNFVFSDLVATDSPLKDIFNFIMTGLDQTPQYTKGNYNILKYGQSQSPIVVLPSEVISPTRRYFSVEGYTDVISTYGFMKYKANSPVRPVTNSTADDDMDATPTTFFKDQGSYEGFSFEVLGVTSSESVPLSTSTGNVDVRGGPVPEGAGSVPSSSYSEIQSKRTSGEGEAFIYPTDLDFGVLLFDSYSESSASNTPQLNFQMQFTTLNDDLPTEIDANLKTVEKSMFVIELPANAPTKENSIAGIWGESLEMDDIDKELLKTQLPFSLANVVDRLRMTYSYSLDDILVGVRSSYLPYENFEKVTNIEIEDIAMDISELGAVSNISTEFPPDGEVGNPNIPLLTSNLKNILQLYVEENLSPSISKDFKLVGFGFGDNEEVPSISDGLEAMSISLGPNGVSTTIKMGSKRRNKESIELRRNFMLRSLAGSKAGRLSSNPVSSTFSNKFLSKF